MVLNATYNNISDILWRSVLLVEEFGVQRENHQPASSHWQTLSHIINQLTTIWIEMPILYVPEISTAGHYEPEIPTASHYEFKN
jgi:hypothetical protein